MKRTAFTLIELLVVIAIIAILVAIAIPVYGAAMEKSRVAQDGSNQRQLGIGIQAYLNDHDDDMFPRTSGTAGPWPQALHAKYVPDWKAYHSPFDRVPTSRLAAANSDASAAVSYGINTQLFGVNSSKFGSPSELIMAAPVMDGGTQIKFSGTSASNVDLPKGGGGGTKKGTHNNRARINALYADAHVKDLLWTEFTRTSGDDGKRRWNPED